MSRYRLTKVCQNIDTKKVLSDLDNTFFVHP